MLDSIDNLSLKPLHYDTESYMELNFRLGHDHLTIYAGAMKPQGIAVPFAFDVVFSGTPVGRFLHQRFCLRDRQRMGSYEVNIGHVVSRNVSATCLILDTGIGGGFSLFLVPCSFFAHSHFLLMPLHENAVAMVE